MHFYKSLSNCIALLFFVRICIFASFAFAFAFDYLSSFFSFHILGTFHVLCLCVSRFMSVFCSRAVISSSQKSMSLCTLMYLFILDSGFHRIIMVNGDSFVFFDGSYSQMTEIKYILKHLWTWTSGIVAAYRELQVCRLFESALKIFLSD